MGRQPRSTPPGEQGGGRRTLWLRRLGWMLGLWAGGVLALWLVAGLIRAVMHAAGMR